MKPALIVCLLFCSNLIYSQPFFNYWEKSDTARNTIQLNSRFESNASSLPNSMLGALLWGGYLDANYLKDVTDKLKNSGNRFGFQFDNQAYYKWKGKKNDWVAGIKYRELFGLKFSRDLFGLAFRGNGPYEGKIADLSNTKLGYWNYTGISFGIMDTINSNSSFYLGFSALYGLNHQTLTTKDAHLYTAPDGEYLRTDGNINVGYKEPGYGLGLALNANYTLRLGKNTFAFGLQDLGFMQFQNFTTFKGDSGYRYNGVRINNLSTYTGDSIFSDFSTRGFASRFKVKESKGSKTVLTPFIVTAYYSRIFNEKWRASFDIYYTYIPAYIPRFTGRIVRTLTTNWNVSAGISYGGFGNQNLLLGAKKEFKRNWSFEIESYFAGLAFTPKNTKGGLGLSAGLRKSF